MCISNFFHRKILDLVSVFHRKCCQICDFPTEMASVLMNSHSESYTRVIVLLTTVTLHEKLAGSVVKVLASIDVEVMWLNVAGEHVLKCSVRLYLTGWCRLYTRFSFWVKYSWHLGVVNAVCGGHPAFRLMSLVFISIALHHQGLTTSSTACVLLPYLISWLRRFKLRSVI